MRLAHHDFSSQLCVVERVDNFHGYNAARVWTQFKIVGLSGDDVQKCVLRRSKAGGDIGAILGVGENRGLLRNVMVEPRARTITVARNDRI